MFLRPESAKEAPRLLRPPSRQRMPEKPDYVSCPVPQPLARLQTLSEFPELCCLRPLSRTVTLSLEDHRVLWIPHPVPG